MNVRKPVDYGMMYRELTAILAQNLPQMGEIYAIGKVISQHPEKGAAVAAAEFLQANFPDRTGFSPRNVRRMRDFYRTYENDQTLLQLAMKNGWTLNAGLITTTQFKVQEDFWGKRYVMKSFQDEYKFGSSADLGVSVAYKFNKVVSADVIVANGEGYKKVQVKDGLQYGAGVTLTPVEGLTVRAYGSYNESVEEGEKGITNLAAFVGYKHTAFSVAAEYNYQTNTKYVPDCDQDGFSVYASAQLSKKISLFGRWDLLSSEKDWNKDADGMAGMVGAEFKLGKYIKLAPNFRLWSPKTEGGKTASYVYLNASFAI